MKEGSAATMYGDAKVDKSTNIKIGDVNVSLQNAELEATVTGAPIVVGAGSGSESESGSSGKSYGKWGKDGNGQGSSSSSKAGVDFEVTTGSNTIRNVSNQTGISAIAQNTGLNSAVQNQVNVNASVGTINR